MLSRRNSGFKIAALFVLLTVLLVPLMTVAAEPTAAPITIQLLNVSDWHAQIDPLNISNVEYGGASTLSTYWKADRLEYSNTLTLTAGDDFGASPPLANFFEEKPSILAQRMMGIQVGSFGNHNFDRGIAHLQQMIDLAAEPKGHKPGKPFVYVSANLKYRHANLDGVQDYEMFTVGGIKIAVVGITNQEAPTLVFPGNFGTIVLRKPHAVAMKVQAQARAAGAQVVVAIIHSGVEGFNSPEDPYGLLVDFANKTSGFDVILGDHTDIQYKGEINGQWVVENRSKGLTYARTILKVTPKNGNVVDVDTTFVTPLTAAVTKDPEIEAMLQPYRDQIAPIFSTVIGTSSMTILRKDSCGNSNGRLCESTIGNLIADAMRNAYATDFAITNSGGIRADLTCPAVDVPLDYCAAFTPPPFPITRGTAQAVLPFGNVVVTLEVNGAELKSLLEAGLSGLPGVQGRFPQVSGLCFTYNISNAIGSRVTSAVRADASGCTATPVDLTSGSTYHIAENDFMVSGGDTYPNFFDRSVSREVIVNVVADYIAANSPFTPALQGRIVCTTDGAPLCPAAP